MKKIEIYTSDTCIQCKKAKEYFQNNNLEFIEYNISSNQEYKRELIKKGYLSVPVIVVEGQDILGFDLTRIKQLTGL
ncbi:MAG: glutaredoxin family protein [Clostridiales bacterium]|jgi:glutaredoxin|uniref:glutaredoxin family protein n=1 Tax=Terrisporobacter sp. TaxID=1965305 RepID=UPI002A4BBE7E|nr:glutaredoxin family protein [Terrisporobacter sp.]MCI6457972.1 glutaredoxin family protein [Clostridium sp.]MDD5877989.1 glutaredoxin family protein [Clostridiales bacterium]MCI7205666.1 glutaredoxin family protein [Clostridium sp.]MDD7753491.1 glutaredoxin family protein [Clostridiales bacterium]MDY4133848.1 glutaredoxin family protein [Terrisporobacter sp.]